MSIDTIREALSRLARTRSPGAAYYANALAALDALETAAREVVHLNRLLESGGVDVECADWDVALKALGDAIGGKHEER